MFTYKNASYKIFALSPKFCWAGLDGKHTAYYPYKFYFIVQIDIKYFMSYKKKVFYM